MTPEEISALVVDDRDANRYSTAHALSRAGVRVTEATTGKDALELSKTLPTVKRACCRARAFPWKSSGQTDSSG